MICYLSANTAMQVTSIIWISRIQTDVSVPENSNVGFKTYVFILDYFSGFCDVDVN